GPRCAAGLVGWWWLARRIPRRRRMGRPRLAWPRWLVRRRLRAGLLRVRVPLRGAARLRVRLSVLLSVLFPTVPVSVRGPVLRSALAAVGPALLLLPLLTTDHPGAFRPCRTGAPGGMGAKGAVEARPADARQGES